MTRLWFHLSLLCVILVGLQLYIIQARTRTQIVVKIIRKWSALSEWLQAILRARGSDQLSKPSTQKLRNRCRLQQLSELHKTNSCSLYIGHPHPTWPPDQCIIHGDSFLAPNHLLSVPELITCHCVNCDNPLAKCALPYNFDTHKAKAWSISDMVKFGRQSQSNCTLNIRTETGTLNNPVRFALFVIRDM